jgi:hypothetical protein
VCTDMGRDCILRFPSSISNSVHATSMVDPSKCFSFCTCTLQFTEGDAFNISRGGDGRGVLKVTQPPSVDGAA